MAELPLIYAFDTHRVDARKTNNSLIRKFCSVKSHETIKKAMHHQQHTDLSAEPKYHGQAAGRAAMAKSGRRAVPWAEIWSEASACRTRSRDGPESAALGTAQGDPRSAGLGAVGCRSPSENEGELGPRRPTVPGPPGPAASD